MRVGLYCMLACLQLCDVILKCTGVFPSTHATMCIHVLSRDHPSDGLGKEVISRFSTDLASNQIFFTDANGREMQTRM